jgi:hypothetical protein
MKLNLAFYKYFRLWVCKRAHLVQDNKGTKSNFYKSFISLQKKLRELVYFSSQLGGGQYQCSECGLLKPSSGLTALKNHVEYRLGRIWTKTFLNSKVFSLSSYDGIVKSYVFQRHLGQVLSYSCASCGKILNTANAYHQHVTRCAAQL